MSAMAQASRRGRKLGDSRWNFVYIWLITGDIGGGNFTLPLALYKAGLIEANTPR